MRALSSSEQQKAKALSTQPQFQNLSTADLRKILPNYGYAPRQVSVILSVATEISGRLHLELAANGTVGMSFVPDAGNAKRLWAGDAGSAETELINRFGLPLNRASTLRAELEKRGTVDEPVNIDEGIARNLYALQ